MLERLQEYLRRLSYYPKLPHGNEPSLIFFLGYHGHEHLFLFDQEQILKIFADITPLRKAVKLQWQLGFGISPSMLWMGLLEPLEDNETSEEFIYDRQTMADYLEEWFDEDGDDHKKIMQAAMFEADLRLEKAK